MSEKKTREDLFHVLDDFISVSHEKFLIVNLKAKERRAWARIGKDCIMAYAKLLENEQLDELAKDVELIKKKVGII